MLRKVIRLSNPVEVRDLDLYYNKEKLFDLHALNIKDIHVFKGKASLHNCRYRVEDSGINLGEMTLTRRTPFKEEELLLIEKVLGVLPIHIRNAKNE